MTPDTPELLPCPFCGTEMRRHEHCFSHPRPTNGDCILRHYSFDKAEAWNRRSPREGETERLVERVALLEAALKLAENALMRLPGDTVLVSPTLLENLRAALTKAHGTL